MPHFIFIHKDVEDEILDPEGSELCVNSLVAYDLGDAVLKLEHEHHRSSEDLLAVLTVEEVKILIYDMEFPKPATNGYWGIDHELKRIRLLSTEHDSSVEDVTESLRDDPRMGNIRGQLLNFFDVSQLLVNLQIEVDSLS